MLNSVAAIALMAAIGPIAGHKFDANPQLPSWAVVSRAGNAMVWDATGKLTYAPNNLITRSSDFSHAAWLTYNGASKVGVAPINGPNGSAAYEISFGSTGGAISASSAVYNTLGSGIAAGVTYIGSMYVRAKSGSTTVRLSVGSNTTTGTGDTIVSDAGWTRIYWLHTTGGANAPVIAIRNNVAGDSANVYVSEAQLEQVTYETTPRAYNPTTSAAHYGARWEYEPNNRLYFDASGAKTYKPNNIALYSNTLSNAAWSKGFSSAAAAPAITDPFGGNAAWKLTEDTNNNLHRLFQGGLGSVVSGANFLLSCYVKAAERSQCLLRYGDGSADTSAIEFDLIAQTATKIGAGSTNGYGIIPLPNGWFRIYVALPSSAAFTAYLGMMNGGLKTWTGDGTSGLYVYGFHLEYVTYQTVPRAYRATTSAAFWLDTTYAFNGLLFEQSAQNLFPKGGPGQLPAASNIIGISTSGATGIDGVASSATTVTQTDVDLSDSRLQQNVTVANDSSSYLLSCFVKKTTGTPTTYPGFMTQLVGGTSLAGGVVLNTTTGAAVGQTGGVQTNIRVDDAGDWWRVSFVITNNSTGNVTLAFKLYPAYNSTGTGTAGTKQGGSATFNYGQIVLGTTLTSPIATFGAAVTRAADVPSDGAYPNNPAQIFYMPITTGVQASQVIDWTNVANLQNVWLREVRIYPIGWFQPVSAYSVDYTQGKLGPNDVFSRAGNAMQWDSSGKLTYAPNNILLRSQDIANAAWGKTRSSAGGTTIAPDGTSTAKALVEDTSNNTHYIQQLPSITTGGKYILSVYAKPNGRDWISISAAAGSNFASFNVATGVIGTIGAGLTLEQVNIQPAANGFYRVSIAFTAAGGSSAVVYTASGDNVTSYTGDGVSGVYLWGLQLEAVTYETTPRTYNPTTSAAYYGARFEYLPDPHQYYDETGKIAYVANNQNIYTNDLNNVTGWQSSNMASKVGGQADPLGGTTAVLATSNGISNPHYIAPQLFTPTQGTLAIVSVYVKYSTQQWVQLRLGTAIGGGRYYNFDIQNGVIGSGNTTNKGIEAVGNGWYRIWILDTLTPALGAWVLHWVTASNSASAETNTSTGALYMAAPQLEFVGASQTTPRAYIANTTGNPYWAPSVNQLIGVPIEEARTNSVRNSVFVGGAAGSPGTLPTNMTASALGTLTQTLAFGTEYGMPYMDIRLDGTTSTTSVVYNFEGVTQIVAANGQTWSGSFYARLIAGSGTNVTCNVQINERNSGGSNLANTLVPFTPTSTLQRAIGARTFTNALTAFTNHQLALTWSNGVAIDITLRIYAPQLEQGGHASSPILTYGAAITRPADICYANLPMLNPNRGSMLVEAIPMAIVSNGMFAEGAPSVGGLQVGISLSQDSVGRVRVISRVGANRFDSSAGTGPIVTPGTVYRSGVSWGIPNGSVNGSSIANAAPPAQADWVLPAIVYLGMRGLGAGSLWGNIWLRKFSQVNDALPQSMVNFRTNTGNAWQ